MKKDSTFFKDFAKFIGSGFSTTVNIKNDLAKYIKESIKNHLKNMDFVTREEFEVLKKVVEKNHAIVSKLEKRKKTTAKKVKK